MTDQQIPQELQSFVKKYPKMKPVIEALTAYHEGRLIIATCLECGQLLTVKDIPEVGARWVGCPKGCTIYNEHYQPNQHKG